MREFEFINWIIRHSRFDPSVVAAGPGDDCAVILLGGEKLLITTDQVLDGVHFSLKDDGAEAAGRKAAGRNLSDIAAMAGEPVAMVAALAAPSGFQRGDAEALYRGLTSAGNEFNCPLVGGDVASWGKTDGKMQVTVTVLGRANGVEPVLRKGAKVGDAVCVTGALGGAWESRRHLLFTPRVTEARLLAGGFPLHAMIDISDGLAADLGHVADAGGAGAEIDADDVPVHKDAAGRDDPLAAALHDGEDYELLFTLPADAAESLVAAQPLGVRVTRIGRIVQGAGLTLVRAGKREKLKPRGWEHKT